MRRLVKAAPFLTALLVVFLLPAVLLHLRSTTPGADVDYGKGIGFAFLLGLNPATALVVALLFTYRYGVTWWFPIAVGLLWIPAAFIAFNSSALVFGIGYAIVAAIGVGLGVAVRRIGRRSSAPVEDDLAALS